MIKAVIFDCFGVVREATFEKTYRSFGGDPQKDRKFIVSTFDDAHNGKIPSSHPVFAQHLGVTLDQWRAASLGAGAFNKDLLDYIDLLKNNYKIAMLSNVSASGLEVHMDVDVLKKYFDPILESSKIGVAKPDTRAYEITAEQLGVACSECIFVDDREDYCVGAENAGMKAILFQDFEGFKEEFERNVG